MLGGLAKSLVDQKLLTDKKLQECDTAAKEKHINLLKYLIEQNVVLSSDIAYTFSIDYGIPFFELSSFDLEFLPQDNQIRAEEVSSGFVLPLFKRGNTIFVALADPAYLYVLDVIKFQTGCHPEPVAVELEKLELITQDLINKRQMGDLEGINDDSLMQGLDISTGEEEDTTTSKISKDDAPIIRFVNKMLLDAINLGASDIHFEPYEKVFRVRFRQDGVLREHTRPPTAIASRIATRIKVMAKLDISERRLPQDGRFKLKLSKSRTIDFRVSTCPTMYGEKVVMRILDPTISQVGIDSLGFEDFQRDQVLVQIEKPQGMVLVTGPTGSGKTVTLYTAIQILNTVKSNISTAEDPIEINLSGINQVNINPRAGLDFATILRAFLRQDPDIIMVGEIRDLETAEISIKAAQTGHMVLSTLHTNSAADTISRLMNMGIPAFNIASSVSVVIAQRLARKLCVKCKTPIEIPVQALLEMGFLQADIDNKNIHIHQATGCISCQDGYKGRTGIFEVLLVDKDMSKIIMQSGSSLDIEEAAIKKGMWTLRKSALEKAKKGIISLEEVNRVTRE